MPNLDTEQKFLHEFCLMQHVGCVFFSVSLPASGVPTVIGTSGIYVQRRLMNW